MKTTVMVIEVPDPVSRVWCTVEFDDQANQDTDRGCPEPKQAYPLVMAACGVSQEEVESVMAKEVVGEITERVRKGTGTGHINGTNLRWKV